MLRIVACVSLVLVIPFGTTGCTSQNMAFIAPLADGGTRSVASNLPCEVNAVLANDCRSCHGAVPTTGVPMSLLTYDELVAPAKTKPSVRVADLCLTRIMDAASPMPPSPTAMAAADIATFKAWLDAGAPSGTCATATGDDPLNAAPACTTNATWSSGDRGSSRMNPGMACVDCHSQGEGPSFLLGGTVYATGHEPDLCDGASGGAEVVITDANGTVTTLTPNAAGNFYSNSRALAVPYTAEVTFNGKTRKMGSAQTSGDCNSCHTQDGTNGAPGRITLP